MKSLTLYDYKRIKEYLDIANYEGYNSNFITMMMWKHEYHIEYEIHDHFLVMLHHYKDELFWSMPFTSKEYYKDAIDYMMKYSKENQFPFIIDCAVESFVDDIKNIYGSQFLYERTRYNDDYIYDKESLRNLSGKKMQKRRNHYNSFKKNYPNYEYRDLDARNDFKDVLKLLSKWGKDQDERTESIISEVYGIMYLLSSMKELDIKAGGIFIDGVLEAFIIASSLHHKTIQIHVEKANKSIRGIYPAILKEFLEHHFNDYLYVNREEDMGLDNLRKSKLALHPIKMVKKYRIQENNLKIVQAIDDDKEEIKKLWFEIFEDETSESTDFYFDNLYSKENTYLLKNNDVIISGMQIVPFEIKLANELVNAYFILGVFTKNAFEKQGCMKKLMNYVLGLDKYKDKKIYLQAYNPEIYKSFGFKPSHYHYQYKPLPEYYNNYDIDIMSDDYSLLEGLYNGFLTNFDEYRIRNSHYFELLMKRNVAFNDSMKIFKHNGEVDGYAIFHNESDHLYVSEIIYKDEVALNRMIATLLTLNKKITIESDLKTMINGEKEKVITMLSNFSNNTNFDDKYINEIY